MEIKLRESAKLAGNQRILFYTDSFLFYRKESFFYEWENGDQYIRMPCRIQDNTLTSLAFSSFGGFDLSDQIITSLLYDFIRHVCLQTTCAKIRIRTYPSCYSPEKWEIQHQALLQAGFEVISTDLNMHLSADLQTFRERLEPAENRYLNIASRHKWQFKRLDPEVYLTSAYQLFCDARAIKGYPLTMELPDLAEMFHHFPENYLLFGVLENERLIAASAAIRINEKVLYDFYHGDDTDLRAKSPVVFLCQGLFDYVKNEGMTVLDLGTCSENGRINRGLWRFKRNLGGQESVKNTYEKQLK